MHVYIVLFIQNLVLYYKYPWIFLIHSLYIPYIYIYIYIYSILFPKRVPYLFLVCF